MMNKTLFVLMFSAFAFTGIQDSNAAKKSPPATTSDDELSGKFSSLTVQTKSWIPGAPLKTPGARQRAKQMAEKNPDLYELRGNTLWKMAPSKES